MRTFSDFVAEIRIALATHPKVTIENARPSPKRLWRVLKKELPVCDVTFDDRNVYVAWKVIA